ncbi:MAG: hypothetical protein RL318_2212 [Fibrobacterota bacterium]|jgi:hypothetical protein
MIRWLLLPLLSALGLWLVFRSARHQWLVWRGLPPASGAEKWLNRPFTVLWYLFLASFCLGLSVNNLLLR